jgi:SH3-like domain-containing protein
MRRLPAAVALILALGAWPAAAAEFRSAAEPAVVLYDAPSVKARKLYIVNRGYPLEVVVQVEGWVKVRDAAGALSWAETRTLDAARTVMVRAPLAVLRQKPADDAPPVAEFRRDVLFDVVDPPAGNWIRVRHRDGADGYLRTADVWGS